MQNGSWLSNLMLTPPSKQHGPSFGSATARLWESAAQDTAPAVFKSFLAGHQRIITLLVRYVGRWSSLLEDNRKECLFTVFFLIYIHLKKSVVLHLKEQIYFSLN